MACLCVLLWTFPIIAVPSITTRDWNEAWGAYWAQIAMQGGTLYPPPDASISNNYPPLYFYITGVVGSLLGDIVLAGRILSVLAVAVIGYNTVMIVKRLGGGRNAAVLAGLLFIAGAAILCPDYRGANDPQWFAHALITGGLVVLLGAPLDARSPRLGRLTAAALLMLAGGMSKHLAAGLPLAVTGWLLWEHRAVAWRWIAVAGALLVAGSAIALLLYGPDLITGLMAPRRYNRYYLPGSLWRFLPMLPMLAAALLAALPLSGFDKRLNLPVLYFVISAFIGTFVSGGEGIDFNSHFDALIASALIAGILFDRAFTVSAESKRVSGALLLLALSEAWLAIPLLRADWQDLRALPEYERQTLADIEQVRRLGPQSAVCDDLWVCYRAGAPFLFDMFNYGQKFLTGRLPEAACAERFSDGRYGVVVFTEVDPPRSWRLPDSCNAAILSHYNLVRTSSTYAILAYRQP